VKCTARRMPKTRNKLIDHASICLSKPLPGEMLIDNRRPRLFPPFLMAVTKPTVLVIDDDSEIRYSLSRVLSSRDYNVSAAASGEEAIAIVKKGAPDVIFLDIRMGGIGASRRCSTSGPSIRSSWSSS